MFGNGFGGDGFLESLGIPDLNHDGNVDCTDVFICQKMIDDEPLTEPQSDNGSTQENEYKQITRDNRNKKSGKHL